MNCHRELQQSFEEFIWLKSHIQKICAKITYETEGKI